MRYRPEDMRKLPRQMKPPKRKSHADFRYPTDQKTDQRPPGEAGVQSQASQNRNQRLAPKPGRRSTAAELLQQIPRERRIQMGEAGASQQPVREPRWFSIAHGYL